MNLVEFSKSKFSKSKFDIEFTLYLLECVVKRMSRLIDLTGQRFGRLVVLERAEGKRKPNGSLITRWHCKCDCGNEVDVIASYLKNGTTKSCGCLQRELQSARRTKYNRYDLSGEVGIGYTFKNQPFYFDKDDYELIKNYCWFYTPKNYITAKIRGTGKHILFHRLILPNCEQVDHINHRKNDNRRCNLRPVNNQINMMNKAKYKNNKSGVTGVIWHNRDNIWEVHIRYKGKQIYLGRYNDFDKAVRTRKEAEEKYFGDHSYDNSMKIAQEVKI